MGYWGWKPYVSAADRRKKAEKAAAKAKKGGAVLMPIAPYRGAIAKTFWGKAWCDNLEHYSDYANRLPRGRTYVRNGSVIDLKITAGGVQAQVIGSSLYKVAVTVVAVPRKQWQAICADCANSIDSLVELLQGKLSNAVMKRICKPRVGLFPAPEGMKFSCSCPDWAQMCKHVAAVLYGVGARLDHQPELLFSLRRVDAKALVAHAGARLPKAKAGPVAGKVLDDSALADVFGIEMAERAPATAPAKRQSQSSATRAVISQTQTKTASTAKRSTANTGERARKTPPQEPAKAKAPTKTSPGSRRSTGSAMAIKAKAGDKADVLKPPAVTKAAARRS